MSNRLSKPSLSRAHLLWRIVPPVVGAALIASVLVLKRADPVPNQRALDEQAMSAAAGLQKGGKTEPALEAIEARLTQHPGSLQLGNFYRAMAVSDRLQDRPVKFLLGQVASLPSPPDEVRYNLAFAYIDKIPVVGPMGAGFLSKRAIKQFQAVLDRDPSNWIANYGIGMNYLHWPEYFDKNDDSMHYFEKCLEIQSHQAKRPYFVLTSIRLGDAYAKVGQVEQARRVWRAGLTEFPGFSDLTSRLALSESETASVIKEMYNPNNSIGDINTDVSILWADQLPASTLPLKRVSIANGGRGIGGQFVADKADSSDARFFSWFKSNLPLLLRRADAVKVDLKGLGATTQNDSRGIGFIASDMVRGFMTQFQEQDQPVTQEMLDKAGAFDRPFLHEGIGMGLAASLDTAGEGSLSSFDQRVAGYDPSFRRLHYAGMGMWYGLSPTINMVRIRKQFADLSLRAQIYAYEGLGFSVELFHQGSTAKGGLEVAERLPFAAASAFAHGAGRAMWIKFGEDWKSVSQTLGDLPDRLRPDALSGFGMGVGFTRVTHPDEFLRIGDGLSRASGRGCADFLTGLAMGLGIRDTADHAYVETALDGEPDSDSDRAAKQLRDISRTSLQSLQDAQVEELHGNWRKAIHDAIDSSVPPVSDTHPCQLTRRS